MPDFKAEVRSRLFRLNLEPTRESAIVEEMAQHLEQRFDELLARGLSPAAARDAVLQELNQGSRLEKDLLQVENQVRFEPAPPPGPGFRGASVRVGKDIRYALRGLRLNPVFAVIAILSLALGIGANTAIFQLLDAVTLRSLPVQDPDRLVLVYVPNAKGRSGHVSGNTGIFSYPIWEQIRDHQQAFSGLAAWYSTGFNLATGGPVHNVRGIMVNGEFFTTLGVRPVLGRVFTPSDDQKGCGLPGAVISYGLWQKQFGGKDSAVGSKLTVEGHVVEVIGVTPSWFYGLEVGRSFDVAVPICSEPLINGEATFLDRRDAWWLAVVGRLKPGWSAARATAQLEALSPATFQATLPAVYQPEQAKKFLLWKMGVKPAATGLSSLRAAYENPLWILLAIAGTVLLIACSNLASLMFARANAREREVAVRLALGASRVRILQQLMMESLLLAGIGTVAGILLAQALTRILIALLNTQFGSVALDLGLDWRVLSFAAVVALLTCLFFGLMPALKATATPPIVAMKTGSRGVTSGRERFGLRRVLVVVQVAMSMMLLVCAFLFVRSFRNLVNVEAGFRQTGILIAEFDFTQLNVHLDQRNKFKQDLVDRLHAIPGVEGAAAASIIPLGGNFWNEDVYYDESGPEVHELVNFNRVSPGYFSALETPFLKGRDFSPENSLNSPPVAIVNEAFVRKVLKGAEPLGKSFHVDEGAGKPRSVYQIIGLVKDTKYAELKEDFFPIAYLADSQSKKPDTSIAVVLRSDLALDSLTASVQHSVAAVSPSIGIQFNVFHDQIRDSLRRERLMANLSGFFGLLAGILATIGLYGVISYMVVRRRNEIGIRMALGANRRSVLALIMREAGLLLALGLAIGTAISLVSTQAAAALLFGLKPRDPMTLALAALSLAAVAIVASYLPAFRATRIHPTEALREE